MLYLAVLAILSTSIDARILDCRADNNQGRVVVRGRYWYTCIDGHYRKDGCLDRQDNKIKLNEAWNENGYEMTCFISDDGRLHVKQTGCIVDNSRYGPDESWSGAKFWYTCAKKPQYIIIEVSGCVVDGRRIRENQRAINGRVVYECRLKETGAIGLCSIGCSHGGREYLIGESWEDEKFTYTCSSRGGCHVEYLGCIQNGRRYQANQEWETTDGLRYRCDVLLGGLKGQVTRLN